MKIVDGRAFECTKCGKCCRWGGVVKLLPEDIIRLAQHLNVSEEDFRDKYTRPHSGMVVLQDAPGSPACVFLKGDTCEVYDSRPKQCIDFPQHYDERCPGFNGDRSDVMESKYAGLVRAVHQRLNSSEDFMQKVSDNLYKELGRTKQASNVAANALAEGIDSHLKGETVKVASLGDLFAFDRVDKRNLIHRSSRDLWSIESDDDGNVQITRLFDNAGEPIKG